MAKVEPWKLENKKEEPKITEEKVVETKKVELTDNEKNIEKQETAFHDIDETADEEIDIEW